ncbi:hypothetical protein [Propioniciclava soli]|uniref:Uncharacterized protein n=1 Tax=Propioniciclava soli TaxID=2775081 RepID=A0ABZ3C7F9_9ACTN|nr:hypothetical protein [Propioniciclava soli]
MSKIATYGDRCRNLRKLIDYFCHLAVGPHAYADIKEDALPTPELDAAPLSNGDT